MKRSRSIIQLLASSARISSFLARVYYPELRALTVLDQGNTPECRNHQQKLDRQRGGESTERRVAARWRRFANRQSEMGDRRGPILTDEPP
jgi:hypothetical protein